MHISQLYIEYSIAGVSVSMHMTLNVESLPKGNSCGHPCGCRSDVDTLVASSILRRAGALGARGSVPGLAV